MASGFLRFTNKRKEFEAKLRQKASNAVQAVTILFATDCKQAVNRANKTTFKPSLAGEPPKKVTGIGQLGIVHDFNNDLKRPAGRVGVNKSALHMAYLDKGTKPRTITAKRAKLLKIPWLKGRSPSKADIKKYGLRKLSPDKFGRTWFYFRKSVKHPGTRPRPWLLATYKKNKAKYGAKFLQLMRAE